ncbi:unnamed protein product, partial [Urochloa humidicola]
MQKMRSLELGLSTLEEYTSRTGTAPSAAGPAERALPDGGGAREDDRRPTCTTWTRGQGPGRAQELEVQRLQQAGRIRGHEAM